MRSRHTDREYEQELQDLRERLLLMAGYVEEMTSSAIRSLVERDSDLAQRTIEADHKVNRLEMETDELCLLILAKRQPMASDLRFITLALKMVTDLERIGDLAVNICERALDLNKVPQLKPYEDIPRMAEIVRQMVHDAIDAFVDANAKLAKEVIERDEEVDRLYDDVFAELLQIMQGDAEKVQRGIHVMSVSKWLERMADHATNLAEQVIFMVKGKDIRHEGKLDEDGNPSIAEAT